MDGLAWTHSESVPTKERCTRVCGGGILPYGGNDQEAAEDRTRILCFRAGSHAELETLP